MIPDSQNSQLGILIVDDEPAAVSGLSDYIRQAGFKGEIYDAFSAYEAIETLRQTKIDIMFLDINMPEISGLDFLESLDEPPLSIITTAYSEYAIEGFNLNAIDYLLKPIEFSRFREAFKRAIIAYRANILLKKEESEVEMYLQQGDSYIRFVPENILYIEAMQNYIKIYFTDKSFIVHQTMNAIQETLSDYPFFRIHKSYLVNTVYIKSVNKNSIFIGKAELPLSKYRKTDLLNSIIHHKTIGKRFNSSQS